MKTTIPKLILPAALVAATLMLGSCGERGKSLSDYRDPSTSDSMLFYYSQLQAYEYMRAAHNDTSLLSEENRKLYMEGVKAGIQAIREGSKNDVYNRGVRRGAQLAMRMVGFEKSYGVKFDDEVYLAGLRYALQNPNVDINEVENQKEFYKIYNRVREAKKEAERQGIETSLVEEARRHSLVKMAPDLYYRISRKGTGVYAREGDLVFVNIDFKKIGGEDLGIPDTDRTMIGAPGVPHVLSEAYSRLNVGSTGIFLTTAENLFKTRAEIMGLEPTDLVLFRVTLNKIEHDIGNLGTDEDGTINDAVTPAP